MSHQLRAIHTRERHSTGVTDILTMIDRLFAAENAWLDNLAAAHAARSARPDELFKRTVAGGVLVACRTWRHAFLNRVFGLPDRDPGEDEFGAMVDEARRRSPLAVRVETRSTDSRLASALRARGLSPSSPSRLKLIRDAEPVELRRTSDLPIRRLDRALDRRQFGQVCQLVFGTEPPFVDVLAELAAYPTFQAFGAFDGDTVVAVGGVTITGEDAYLSPGATAATHRGRGLQAALMAARIEACRQTGVTLISGDTALPEPGANNPSANNFRRLGFRIAYEIVPYEAGP